MKYPLCVSVLLSLFSPLTQSSFPNSEDSAGSRAKPSGVTAAVEAETLILTKEPRHARLDLAKGAVKFMGIFPLMGMLQFPGADPQVLRGRYKVRGLPELRKPSFRLALGLGVLYCGILSYEYCANKDDTPAKAR